MASLTANRRHGNGRLAAAAVPSVFRVGVYGHTGGNRARKAADDVSGTLIEVVIGEMDANSAALQAALRVVVQWAVRTMGETEAAPGGELPT